MNKMKICQGEISPVLFTENHPDALHIRIQLMQPAADVLGVTGVFSLKRKEKYLVFVYGNALTHRFVPIREKPVFRLLKKVFYFHKPSFSLPENCDLNSAMASLLRMISVANSELISDSSLSGISSLRRMGIG